MAKSKKSKEKVVEDLTEVVTELKSEVATTVKPNDMVIIEGIGGTLTLGTKYKLRYKNALGLINKGFAILKH